MTAVLAIRHRLPQPVVPLADDVTTVALDSGRRGSWSWKGGSALAALILMTATTVSAASLEGDTGGDLLGLLRIVGKDLLNLRWQFAVAVITLGLLHYLAAAVAARAAAGIRLPLGTTVLAQLAASTADRLTPGGVGAAAVNARYFNRQGLTLPAALGAVLSLHVVGPVTDALVLALLVLAGAWVGLNGGAHEVGSLTGKVTQLLGVFRSPWVLAAIAGISVIAIGRTVWRRRSSGVGRDWKTFWVPIRQLLAHPSRLATLAAASGATTLVLAFAFAASVAMVPGPRPIAGLGALMIAFLLATAAGNALPIPGGLGTTEAALIGVLVGMHVPTAAAVQQVLIFRIITFWLPALVGIFAARTLRRRLTL